MGLKEEWKGMNRKIKYMENNTVRAVILNDVKSQSLIYVADTNK
jgi:hypothetical protein